MRQCFFYYFFFIYVISYATLRNSGANWKVFKVKCSRATLLHVISSKASFCCDIAQDNAPVLTHILSNLSVDHDQTLSKVCWESSTSHAEKECLVVTSLWRPRVLMNVKFTKSNSDRRLTLRQREISLKQHSQPCFPGLCIIKCVCHNTLKLIWLQKSATVSSTVANSFHTRLQRNCDYMMFWNCQSNRVPAIQRLTHAEYERFRTFAWGEVIWALPGPVGEAAKRPMAHAEIEASGALQHHQRAELAQASVQQAVGHVLRQHSLDVGTVDGWKTQRDPFAMGLLLISATQHRSWKSIIKCVRKVTLYASQYRASHQSRSLISLSVSQCE